LKDISGQQTLQADNWASLLARFNYIIYCIPGELSQEVHPSLDSGQSWFRGYFGIKQSPRNTDSSPLGKSDVPFRKWYKVSPRRSTCLKLASEKKV